MAVSPVGNTTFINQNSQVSSTQHANAQAKLDFQALVNIQEMENKQNEIAEVRPAEDIKKTDEDAKGSKQEQEKKEKKNKKKQKKEQEKDEIVRDSHGDITHLDISV
ncbi:hypothetical protein [Helicobacter ibis]|uniref:Uncharacterized protein n=1 Tax=Helicobacter ibis TaxID=2962633 RepID=A0ABT4VC34_9HELI|nr:hypothetical protein [Helicobacter ibis]MDA3968157.1 hypothetical protein [Helicobacter ibis]